jgi:serine/threonine-protein kinase
MDARKLEAARALEQRGQLEAAGKAYAECGALDDAARVLAGAQRFSEAGKLLADSLGALSRQPGGLHPTLRARAQRAAVLLVKGGQGARAAELYLAAGDAEKALGLFVQHKRFREAADVARGLGRLGEAADLLGQAGLAYEAAAGFLDAGEVQGALEQLARVPRDGPQYRPACVLAVRLLRGGGTPSFEVEQMLATFLESAPRGDEEIEAFYEMGRLYAEQGLAHDAKPVFERLLAVAPDYRDAAANLAYIEAESAPPAFGDDLLPDLPEAPQLPDPAELRAAAAAAAEPAPAPGDGPIFVVGAVIAERYRLDERIGAGGMAVVFRATDVELGESIALKVFTQVVHDEQAEERFKRELRLSRQLQNPHIVRLFDIGTYRGIRYISMELLKGCDLRARMAAQLSYRDALDYLIQACSGLQAAHEAGVIHRDFKPENCFITEGGLVKIMDFGIAKVQSAPGITTTGIVVGTPAYIAPEQVSNFAAVSFASDLYALGVVAYELFSGRLPFTDPEPMRLLMMHINEAPRSPRTHNPAIPEELERVILKLLEKEPAKRFASAGDLAVSLEEIRAGLPA